MNDITDSASQKYMEGQEKIMKDLMAKHNVTIEDLKNKTWHFIMSGQMGDEMIYLCKTEDQVNYKFNITIQEAYDETQNNEDAEEGTEEANTEEGV